MPLTKHSYSEQIFDHRLNYVGTLNQEIRDFTGQTFGLDGSGGVFTADPRLRRFGVAVVHVSTDHDDEDYGTAIGAIYGPLAGYQTVGRAELFALITLAINTMGNITAYTDCMSVYIGFQKEKTSFSSNMCDLWDEFWTHYAARVGSIVLIWTPSHVSIDRVLLNDIEPIGHLANEYADHFAGMAATANQHDPSTIAETHALDKLADNIQDRLAAISVLHLEVGGKIPKLAKPQPLTRRQANSQKRKLITEIGHFLVPQNGKWFCKNCNQSAIEDHVVKWLKKGKCQGAPKNVRGVTQGNIRKDPGTILKPSLKALHQTIHPSHFLQHSRGVLCCTKCGGHAQDGMWIDKRATLGKQCVRKPASESLKRWADGVHPDKTKSWPEASTSSSSATFVLSDVTSISEVP
jgi:hypothetical protein